KATFDHNSLVSLSSRKMLARSQSRRLVASRAIRSSSAPKSRSEFIFWQIARMAESFSCNSDCGDIPIRVSVYLIGRRVSMKLTVVQVVDATVCSECEGTLNRRGE